MLKPEQVIEIIKNKTNMTEDEIRQKIKEKQDEFKGLLTSGGAAYAVAKELKIKIDDSDDIMRISDLKPGMEDVHIVARVSRIYSPRFFEKNGKRGKVCNIDLLDDSGTIRFVLWHRDVEKVETGDIDIGDVLDISGAHIKNNQDRLELHTGVGSRIDVISDDNIPKVELKTIKIADIKPNMQDVSVFGKILRVNQHRTFMRDGRERGVVSFLISDGSKVRVVVWNPTLSFVRRLRSGLIVRVDHGYTKEGMQGIELHIGWQGRVLLNPKNAPDLSNVTDLIDANLERKFIHDLKTNETAEVRGTLVQIYPVRDYYICPKCRKRLNKDEICPEDNSKAERRIVINAELDDGSECVRTVFYNEVAKQLLNLTATENIDLEKLNESAKELLGNEFIVQGRVREGFNGRNEFIVNRLVSKDADPTKEIGLLKSQSN